MKTQNTSKLGFTKNSIVELNDDHLKTVNGGSLLITLISLAVSAAVGYTVEQMLD